MNETLFLNDMQDIISKKTHHLYNTRTQYFILFKKKLFLHFEAHKFCTWTYCFMIFA
jgi:hypothetical protein